MQVDVQQFLDLVEDSNRICFWDTETTGRHGDYNSMLVSSIRDKDGVYTVSTLKPGDDKRVIKATFEMLETYLVVVTYYGKGFDAPFFSSRALRWGLPTFRDLSDLYHLDMYFALRGPLLLGRRSQAHLLEFVQADKHMEQLITKGEEKVAQKMTVPPELWNLYQHKPRMAEPVMRQRCESDTEGLKFLYEKTRQMVRDLKKG